MVKSKEALEAVIRAFAQYPDDVVVEGITDDLGVLLKLKVHKDDMGRVIGKQGETAKAIRTLLRVIGMTENARVNLKIEEPEGSDRKPDTYSV